MYLRIWKRNKSFFISGCGSCNIETCGAMENIILKNLPPGRSRKNYKKNFHHWKLQPVATAH